MAPLATCCNPRSNPASLLPDGLTEVFTSVRHVYDDDPRQQKVGVWLDYDLQGHIIRSAVGRSLLVKADNKIYESETGKVVGELVYIGLINPLPALIPLITSLGARALPALQAALPSLVQSVPGLVPSAAPLAAPAMPAAPFVLPAPSITEAERLASIAVSMPRPVLPPTPTTMDELQAAVTLEYARRRSNPSQHRALMDGVAHELAKHTGMSEKEALHLIHHSVVKALKAAHSLASPLVPEAEVIDLARHLHKQGYAIAVAIPKDGEVPRPRIVSKLVIPERGPTLLYENPRRYFNTEMEADTGFELTQKDRPTPLYLVEKYYDKLAGMWAVEWRTMRPGLRAMSPQRELTVSSLEETSLPLENPRKRGKLHVKERTIRERQFHPQLCVPGTYRSKKTKTGHVLTFCVRKDTDDWDLQSIIHPRTTTEESKLGLRINPYLKKASIILHENPDPLSLAFILSVIASVIGGAVVYYAIERRELLGPEQKKKWAALAARVNAKEPGREAVHPDPYLVQEAYEEEEYEEVNPKRELIASEGRLAKQYLPFFQELADAAGIDTTSLMVHMSFRVSDASWRVGYVVLPTIAIAERMHGLPPNEIAIEFIRNLQRARSAYDAVGMGKTIDHAEMGAKAEEAVRRVSSERLSEIVAKHFPLERGTR